VLATLGDLVEDVIVRLDGPVNIASDTPATISHRRGGSAANTAAAAARHGAAARFLGQVGTDAIGGALLEELAQLGVDVSMVRRSGSTGTIVALVDDRGERSMLTDRRTCTHLADPDPGWLDGVDVLHVPFYSLAVGAIAATARTLIAWAHERDIAVSIDLSSTSVMDAFGVEEVRRSIVELSPAIVFANRDETAAFDTSSVPTGTLLVEKRGPDAAVLHRSHGSAVEVPAIAVDGVDDTTGAGDAFAAGFLTADWRDDPVGACESGHRTAAGLLTSRATR
jgi:sugar/nucleoside kinase (ribokinase family)